MVISCQANLPKYIRKEENKMGYIYKITNNINSLLYIGATTNALNVRWRKHKTCSKDVSYTSIIYKAMRIYGVENFKIELIEQTNDLECREQYWTDKLNTIHPNGYNMTIGGLKLEGKNNPFYGQEHSYDTKQNLSAKAKQKTGSKNNFYGKHHTDETKQKISSKNKNRIPSHDVRIKMSLAQSGLKNHFYGKHHTNESKQKLSDVHQTKNIYMIDEENKFYHFENFKVLYSYLKNTLNLTTKYESVVSGITRSIKNNKSYLNKRWTIGKLEGVETNETIL